MMKGVIFNVVEEIVGELFSPETWDDLLDAADLDGAYTALGDYADGELLAIVAQASKATGMSADEVLRTVGYHALPKLTARVPPELTAADSAFGFIRRVNDIIHPEVLKIYPQSTPPAFTFDDHAEGLLVHYHSVRAIPSLAEGLLSGVNELFEDNVEVERVETSDGEQRATFLVRSIS